MRAGIAAAALALAAWATGLPGTGWGQVPGRPATVSDQQVHEVATRLRCVVCQNLSVADSPSEMANQMRAIVRERLQAGESPDQVVRYFVDKYGEWILLAPEPTGFNLIVWLAPAAAVAGGLLVVTILLRRWTRPRPSPPPASTDPALRERIHRDLEQIP